VPVSQTDQDQFITSILITFNHLRHVIDASWNTSQLSQINTHLYKSRGTLYVQITTLV